MLDTKSLAKSILKKVGFYEQVHQLWSKRPDWHALCLNIGYQICKAPDGLPIPDAHLINMVILSKEVAWFLHSGRLCADSIRYALQKNGYGFDDFETILDFGCGCGRVIRYWSRLVPPQRLYGTDINPELIAWDQKHLNKIADFQVNALEPPLKYPANFFDFVYAISVFTHLPESLQFAWINELHRILRLGGLLLISVHGESRFFQLTPAEQARFKAGSLVVKHSSSPGSNLCGVYHPEFYVRNCLARNYDVVDFIPRGVRDADQDIYLFRKHN